MTAFESEAALAAFIRQQLDRLPLAGFISQLQTSLAQNGRLMSLRYGTGTLTYTASTTSGTVTVSHGMAGAPVGVLFGNLPPLNTTTVFRLSALSAAQFDVSGYQADDVAITNTQSFFWLAVG